MVGEGEVKQALQLEGGWGVACMAAFGKVRGFGLRRSSGRVHAGAQAAYGANKQGAQDALLAS